MKKFEQPTMEITIFSIDDIITVSGNPEPPQGPDAGDDALGWG